MTVFSCGEDFLCAALDKPYDIVFMDVYLTGIKGVDAILETSSRDAVQFVFITTSKEHVIEAFNMNAAHSHYLSWNYNDPETAVAGVAFHAFEWLFVRSGPIIFLGTIVGVFLTRKIV